MRNKITFEQRVQVLLDKDEPKQVDGRSGPEYMRVCDNDASIIFAPPALEAAIQAAGARAGDVIQIDRLTRGKAVEWQVGIIGDTSHPPEQLRARTAAALRTAAPAAAAPARPTGPAIRSDAAEDAAAMAAAFAAAIIATGEAEQHAARAGIRELRLTDRETITRVALSIYIGRQKAGAQ